MSKYCDCGCGEVTAVAERDDPRFGYVRGKHKRFVHGHNSKSEHPRKIDHFWTPPPGERSPGCQCGCGGETRYARGVWSRFLPGHQFRIHKRTAQGPALRSSGYVSSGGTYEHVAVAEAAFGGPLPPGAQVHHVNRIRSDNRPGNLVVCEDAAYHALLHVRTEALDACGDPNKRKCTFCGEYDDPSNMKQMVSGPFFHSSCRNRKRREVYRARRELTDERRRAA